MITSIEELVRERVIDRNTLIYFLEYDGFRLFFETGQRWTYVPYYDSSGRCNVRQYYVVQGDGSYAKSYTQKEIDVIGQ
jgi:hypothetical protein